MRCCLVRPSFPCARTPMTSDRSNQDSRSPDGRSPDGRSVVRRQEAPAVTTRPPVTPLSPSVVFRAEVADALDAVSVGRAAGFSFPRNGHPTARLLLSHLSSLTGSAPEGDPAF